MNGVVYLFSPSVFVCMCVVIRPHTIRLDHDGFTTLGYRYEGHCLSSNLDAVNMAC